MFESGLRTNQSFFNLLKSTYVYKINKLDIFPFVSGSLKPTVVYQYLSRNNGISVGGFCLIYIDINPARGSMALTDIKVRTVKPADKPFKLTDGEGIHL